MAHPLKKYARFVQRELAKDERFDDASYQWCLQQVQEHWKYAEGMRAADRKATLLHHIKKVARKSRAPAA